MNSPAAPSPVPPLAEADLNRLQVLLDKIPEPLEPLDISMLDGYLCGVLLQHLKPVEVGFGERRNGRRGGRVHGGDCRAMGSSVT